MSTPEQTPPGGGLLDWMRRHRSLVIGGAVVAVLGLVFVLVWFEPQKLFLDDTVDEAFPQVEAATTLPSTTTTTVAPTTTEVPADPAATTTSVATTTTSTTTTTTTTTTAGPVLLTEGEFIDIGHPGSGVAQVYQLPDGSRVLRLEDLDVSNGPDLVVILSTSPLVDDRNAYDDEFFDLGELKGNIGNQNYDIPADVDLDEWVTVAIWCRRFNYTFNAAPLTPVAETS